MIQLHTDLEKLPRFNNAAVTIGTYDGVHLGHQQIIRQLKSEAESIGGETVIITFYPHPRSVVSKEKVEVKLLTTLKEKTELLDAYGVEHLVVVPFTVEFANQPAEDYVRNFLVEKFHPHTIIIGYDHRFGRGRRGDYRLLEELGQLYGYKVKEIPEKVISEAIVSSSRIRDALNKSDVHTANKLLGHEYFFEGRVVEGNKLGRTIGYPTANLEIEDTEKLIPANGVYAVAVNINGAAYQGMMNIGVRPTVDGTKRMIEVNIFEFDKDIYGCIVRVYLKQYLRGEQKFSGLDQLKDQLRKDKEAALQVLLQH